MHPHTQSGAEVRATGYGYGRVLTLLNSLHFISFNLTKELFFRMRLSGLSSLLCRDLGFVLSLFLFSLH